MISRQFKIRTRRNAALLTLASLAGLVSNAFPASSAYAASPAQEVGASTAAPAAGTRFAGTVTAVNGNTLTVKGDAGAEVKIAVPDSARILQLPAGSKSLTSATTVKLQDIAVGDRILAKTTPGADASSFTASTVLAMKQADVAQKQQRDREDWQTRGISGVVKSVDPAARSVTVSVGAGSAAKVLAVEASKATAVRRYAPDSTKFDDAKTSTLDEIKPGDQLRAKGDKSADGTQFTAEAIVTGTFHNVAGTVLSVDAAANSLTVTDLATKQPFVVRLNAESQLHKLPPAMAQGMAMRLKGGAGAPSGSGEHAAPGGQALSAPAGTHPPSGAPSRPNGAIPTGAESTSAGPGTHGGGDVQQMLNRAPTVQISDLKAGDAVMVLTTEGQTPGTATAITLIAGVEPLLQASPGASQSMLSASWNLGSGGAAGQDAQ